jgi:hypothetical protein
MECIYPRRAAEMELAMIAASPCLCSSPSPHTTVAHAATTARSVMNAAVGQTGLARLPACEAIAGAGTRNSGVQCTGFPVEITHQSYKFGKYCTGMEKFPRASV